MLENYDTHSILFQDDNAPIIYIIDLYRFGERKKTELTSVTIRWLFT